MKYFLPVLIVLFLAGCSKRPEKSTEKPLARVYDKYLFRMT